MALEPGLPRVVHQPEARVWQHAAELLATSESDAIAGDGRWAARCVVLALLGSGWYTNAFALACCVHGVAPALRSPEAGSAIVSRWLRAGDEPEGEYSRGGA